VGRKAGITEEQLLDLAEFERSTHFNEREKRALRLTVALTRTPAEVPDELFVVLRGEFSERELVELTNAIAWENYRAVQSHVRDRVGEFFERAILPASGTVMCRLAAGAGQGDVTAEGINEWVDV